MKNLIILSLSMLVMSCGSDKEIKLSDLYADKNFYTHVVMQNDTVIGVELRLNSNTRERINMGINYYFSEDSKVKKPESLEKKGYKHVGNTWFKWSVITYPFRLLNHEFKTTGKPFSLVIDNVDYQFTSTYLSDFDKEYNIPYYENKILSDDEVFIDKFRKAKSVFLVYDNKKEDLSFLKKDANILYAKLKSLENNVFVKDCPLKFDVESDVVVYNGDKVKFTNSSYKLTEDVIKLIITQTCDNAKRVCNNPLTFKPIKCSIYDGDGVTTVSLVSQASNSFNVPGELSTYAKFKGTDLIDVDTF